MSTCPRGPPSVWAPPRTHSARAARRASLDYSSNRRFKGYYLASRRGHPHWAGSSVEQSARALIKRAFLAAQVSRHPTSATFQGSWDWAPEEREYPQEEWQAPKSPRCVKNRVHFSAAPA